MSAEQTAKQVSQGITIGLGASLNAAIANKHDLAFVTCFRKRRWDRSQAADEHVALSTELAATSFDSELAEPASGSAEPAVLHSSAAALDDPHGRRPDSETLPEHHDPPMSEPPRKLGAPAEFTANVDINDSDNRQMLAKSSTHISIAEATGVEVATRGRHYADASEASSADPALHLHLEATSQDMLDRAIEMVEVMKGDGPAIAHSHSLLYADGVDGANYAHSDQQLSGRQSSADGGQQRLQDKVYVEVESVRGFNVRAKLIGTGGENMKYIQNTTGARVQVRGNGSGCDDNAQGSDPYEPMHLYITATSEDSLNQAKEYCTSLIETLHAQYHEFKDIGSRRYEPSSNHRDSRDYDRDRHQSSRHRSDRHYSGRSQQSYYPSRQEYPPQHEYLPQHAYAQAYEQQGYPQQGHSQPQHQTAPSGAADAAAYDEYAKYYAQYYQYYGTYPDQSAYYGQAGYGTAQQLVNPQNAYAQGQPQHPTASAVNTSNRYDETAPSSTSLHQNSHHSVPPPADYSNNKV